MTNGPPPSSAGSSHHLSQFSTPLQSQPQPSAYYPAHGQPTHQPLQSTHTPGQSYFNANYQGPSWQQNAWQLPTHPYSPGTTSYQQNYGFPQVPYPQYQSERPQPVRFSAQIQPQPQPQPPPPPKSRYNKPPPAPKVHFPTPSPPPPEFHRHWDSVIVSFLSSLGLTQALRGFENDMLVVNEDWERQKVPKAIGDLMRDLMSLGQSPNIDRKERSLDERKLDYTHVTKDTEPRSQTSINKSISLFLAQNRARNDASNRAEFLQSLAEKRRQLNPDTEDSDMASISEASCARTDAKLLNRDVQMKYDIAKNEEGPLRRTVKHGAMSQDIPNPKGKRRQTAATMDRLSQERHPGLDERLANIESHLAVRYVPSPPQFLLDRLKFLEDHLIRLEKDYPPWAALHFNQPHRGWPPPPRPTPIIVPSHLTSTNNNVQLQTAATSKSAQSSQDAGKAKNTKSSLHRAVMERLEVQKAMSDLAGRGVGNAEEHG